MIPAARLAGLLLLAGCAGGTSPKDSAGGDDTGACTPTTWYRDADGDTYGDAAAPRDACAAPEGYVADATDCDDAAAAVHPGAPEIWYDGADEDCAGDDDFDQDRDGATRGADCDDTDAAVHPGATEDCATEADDNCDGQTDEPDALGCTPWYADADADGSGVGEPVCACAAHDAYTATTAGDCDDARDDVYPGATEVCDGADQDCNGTPDDGMAVGYADTDGDGYGDAGSPTGCDGGVADGTDCDDTNAAIHPGVAEVCDGVDQDCDGAADDGLPLSYRDADGDGDGTGTGSCEAPAGWVATGTDCDDADPWVYSGAPELCDHRQNDCAATAWSEADEDGTVSFQDTAGAWYDYTAILTTGSSGAPVVADVGMSGTLEWCPGAYFVNLSVPSGRGVALDLDFPYGPASVTLDGGGVGRILSLESGNGPFRINGGAFQGGYATTGGAIWNDGNDLTLQDSQFSSNVATFAGGAIGQGGGTLTLRTVTAEYNQAAAWGGAVYVGDASLDVSNSVFSYNEATGGTGDGLYGGAICAFSTAGNVDISVDGSSFLGNEATSWGETFASGGTVAVDVAGPSTVSLSNSTVSESAAYAATDAYGGAISVNVSGAVTVTLTSIDQDHAYASAGMDAVGGAIFLGNSSTEPMTLTDVTLYQDAVYTDVGPTGAGLAYRSYASTTSLVLTALDVSAAWTYDSGGVPYGDGGGVYLGMTGGAAELTGALIYGCEAETGAGVSMNLAGGANVSVDGGTLVSNNEGEGVRVNIVGDYGYLYISDGSVEANTGDGIAFDAVSGTYGTLYLYGSTARQGSLANGGIGVNSGCGTTSSGACSIYASLWDLGDYGSADDNAGGDIYFFGRLYDRLGTDWSGNCLTSAC